MVDLQPSLIALKTRGHVRDIYFTRYLTLWIDSEVGDKTDPERTGFHRVKVFVIDAGGRLAGQSGCVEIVNRMPVRVTKWFKPSGRNYSFRCNG